MTNITTRIGDSAEFQIPLVWGHVPFDPGSDWTLIFTAKHSANDPDSSAAIQKGTGAGMVVTGSKVALTLVPQDTVDLSAGIFVADIQAQNLTSGEVRTVADISITLTRDITRATTVTIPICTTEAYVARGPAGPAGDTDATPDNTAGAIVRRNVLGGFQAASVSCRTITSGVPFVEYGPSGMTYSDPNAFAISVTFPELLAGYGAITWSTGTGYVALTDNANGSITPSVASLTQSGATVGQVIAWSGSEWTPVTIPASNTYTAGSGLSLTGTSFSIGAGAIQNSMLANGAVSNLSGTNTGDETASTIKSKLGVTALSGSNTGDQALPTLFSLGAATAAQGAKADMFSSPLLSNESRLMPFWKQLIPFQESSDPIGKYVVMAGFLDSIGTTNGPTPFIGQDLYAKFGCGALMSAPLGALCPNDYNLVPTYAGGAGKTPNTPTGSDGVWTYLPNGVIFNIPSGGSVSEVPSDVNVLTGFQKIRCFYGIKSGGGTMSVTVAQNGTPLTAKTANTSTGTVGGIGYIELTPTDGLTPYGPPTILTAASGATVDYLGSLVYLRSGAIVLNMGRGSSSSTMMATVANANFTYLQDVFGMSLAVHAAKGETNEEIIAWFDRVAAAMPKCSHLVLGNSPSSDDAGDLQSREEMRNKALEKKWVFFDAGEFLKSFAEMSAMGWDTDTTHLTQEVWRLQAGWLSNRILNLSFCGLALQRSVVSPVTQVEVSGRFLSDTTRRACFSTLYGSQTGTGWTRTVDRGRNSIGWDASGPVNSGVDTMWTDLLLDTQIYGFNDTMFRWQMVEGFGTNVNMTVKLGFGIGGQPPFVLAASGYCWEFGVDGTTGPPWMRFELHDGATRYLSPKFYIPIASGGVGYIRGSYQYANWAMKVDGSGPANPKRLRCWMSPTAMGNTSTKTVKPVLVADWSVTVGNPGWTPSGGSTQCSWAVLSHGAVSSSWGSVKMLSFEADFNCYDPTKLLPFKL